jgi:hypothetical protein
MPPESKKRRLFPRLVSFFGNRGSASDHQQSLDEIEGAGTTGPFQSACSSPHSDEVLGASTTPPTHSSPHAPAKLPIPVGTSTPNGHEPQPPLHRQRRENIAVDFQQRNVAVLRPAQPMPFSAWQFYDNDNPVASEESTSVNDGTPSFLAGASGFRMGDINVYNTGGVSAKGSIDGTSIVPGGLKRISLNRTPMFMQDGSCC